MHASRPRRHCSRDPALSRAPNPNRRIPIPHSVPERIPSPDQGSESDVPFGAPDPARIREDGVPPPLSTYGGTVIGFVLPAFFDGSLVCVLTGIALVVAILVRVYRWRNPTGGPEYGSEWTYGTSSSDSSSWMASGASSSSSFGSSSSGSSSSSSSSYSGGGGSSGGGGASDSY